MIVNLFDSLFTGSSCSVAWATSRHIQYVRGERDWDGVTIFTDAQVNTPVVDQVRSRHKIGWLREPRCLHPETYEAIDPSRFDIVLTYDAELMQERGFAFVPYGGIWIPERDRGVCEKSKLISMLYGAKKAATGHMLRHAIAERVPGIDYYGYSGTPVNYSPATKVRVHRDYMFSVVVETCNEPNLFTEILLDCMVMGTVPVLWGCPNSGDFFDDDGIIHFDTVGQLSAIVDNLSTDKYNEMLPAIRRNAALALDFAVTEDWIYENILWWRYE